MRNRIYTFRGCTFDVPRGERTATVTRHADGVVQSFTSLPEGPSAVVQGQRWAMGIGQGNLVAEMTASMVKHLNLAEAATDEGPRTKRGK